MADHLPADKLARVCGMFGSSHDGERSAAAALADKMVRDAGLTWPDVIKAPPPKVTPATAAECLRWRDRLTPWEAGFCANVSRYRQLTDRQAAVLQRIVTKIREAGR